MTTWPEKNKQYAQYIALGVAPEQALAMAFGDAEAEKVLHQLHQLQSETILTKNKNP